MTRALLLVTSIVGAFTSCVSGTYSSTPLEQSTGQQDQYMQGSNQNMSMEGGSMGSEGSSKGGGSGAPTVVQNNINIMNQDIIIIATNAGGSSQTQQMNSQIQPPVAIHTVTVGGDAGLIYSPDTISAAMYDMVQFNFMAKNHTVTQSTFPKPCNKMMGGIDSGFMPNDGTGIPPMMMVQVNSTMPIWFYCRQKMPMPHCGAGMTFSINPAADKTQAAFKAQAIAINGTATATSGGMMMGGASMPAAAAPVVPEVTTAAAQQAAATMPAAADAQQNSGSVASSESGNLASNPMMVSGTGQMDAGGSCTCSCMCGTQAFAADSGLGLGMIGGLPAQIAAVAGGIAYKA